MAWNQSNSTETGDSTLMDTHELFFLSYVTVCYISMITVLATVFNIFVIKIYSRSRLRKKKMLLINLAVAEFLLPTSNYWMIITSSPHGYWIYGQTGCDYYSFSTGLFGMVSIGTLTAMAIERYIVCHNFVHMHWSVKYKCYVIGGTWLYGFMMVLPPLFGWGRYSIDLYKPSCTFDYYSSDWNTKSFAIFLLVCGFVIPASIILYCYSGMFKNIVANERNMRAMSLRPILGRLNSSGSNANHNEPKKIPLLKRRKSASLSELDKLCRGGVSRLSRRRHHSISFNDILLVLNNQTIQPQTSCWQFGSLSRRNETQFAKLILMVILGFFACWTPYAILTILCQLRVEAAFSPTAAAVTLLFAKSSCAINPIIYGLKEKKFRQEIFKIFGG